MPEMKETVDDIAGRQQLMAFKGLHKFYGGQDVLQVQDLIFYTGDRVLICGANGSGKSTLLKLITSVTLPSKGNIIRTPFNSARKAGYLPQSGGLYMDLTLEENLGVYADLYAVRNKTGYVEQMMSDLELFDHLHKRISDLSGGFQRLAAFLAVLSVRPKVLLMDEPFSGVDTTKTLIMKSILADLANSLDLMILTSPDKETFSLANRIIKLKNGLIV